MIKLLNVATSIAFGTSVIIATSLQASEREPLDWQDLDHFQVDCSLKKEQTEYLNSMRTTNKKWARFQWKFMPWQAVTDGEGYEKNKKQATGAYDWLINQHLHTIASQC